MNGRRRDRPRPYGARRRVRARPGQGGPDGRATGRRAPAAAPAGLRAAEPPRPRCVPFGAALARALTAALAPRRWEPWNPYNDHRAYPSPRCAYLTDTTLRLGGDRWPIDPVRLVLEGRAATARTRHDHLRHRRTDRRSARCPRVRPPARGARAAGGRPPQLGSGRGGPSRRGWPCTPRPAGHRRTVRCRGGRDVRPGGARDLALAGRSSPHAARRWLPGDCPPTPGRCPPGSCAA